MVPLAEIFLFGFHGAVNGLFLRGLLNNMQIFFFSFLFAGSNGSIWGNWGGQPPEEEPQHAGQLTPTPNPPPRPRTL